MSTAKKVKLYVKGSVKPALISPDAYLLWLHRAPSDQIQAHLVENLDKKYLAKSNRIITDRLEKERKVVEAALIADEA